MITVELVGELADYIGVKKVSLNVKTPIRLRDVLNIFISSLSGPQRNILVKEGKVYALVILNGTLETNYDKLVTEGDKVGLILPIEGG